jgi:hypothetical protein
VIMSWWWRAVPDLSLLWRRSMMWLTTIVFERHRQQGTSWLHGLMTRRIWPMLWLRLLLVNITSGSFPAFYGDLVMVQLEHSIWKFSNCGDY